MAGHAGDAAGVSKINGRFPINYKYAGQTFYLADDLAAKYPNGVKIYKSRFP
jgi:hypothetical protein